MPYYLADMLHAAGAQHMPIFSAAQRFGMLPDKAPTISLSCSMWQPSAYSVPSASKVTSLSFLADECTCMTRSV